MTYEYGPCVVASHLYGPAAHAAAAQRLAALLVHFLAVSREERVGGGRLRRRCRQQRRSLRRRHQRPRRRLRSPHPSCLERRERRRRRRRGNRLGSGHPRARGRHDAGAVFVVHGVGALAIQPARRQLAPHVELASELRYRNAPMNDRTLVLAISQSGETADTLAALKDAKSHGARILSVCNVIEASIPRLCDGTLYTHAGPEISVASTKAFTTQVAALHMFALHVGRLLGRIDDETMTEELDALVRVAGHMERQLQDMTIYEDIARAWHEARSTLYLGRGALFPLALEGALKLKEISYIHAEGYAAGEMKHGPIALVDERVPTVVLAPRDTHHEKVRSNLQEVKARRGPILVIHTEGDADTAALADFAVPIPDAPPHVLPLVCAIPMQLIAYVMADYKGTDIDQPRNLAKSVTVE